MQHLTSRRYASLDSEFTVDVYQGGRYNSMKTLLHGSCSFHIRDLTDNLAETTECESWDGILLWLRSTDSFGVVGTDLRTGRRTLRLKNNAGKDVEGEVVVSIQPQPPELAKFRQPPDNTTFSTFRQLMQTIARGEIPEHWKAMKTLDGRTYFEREDVVPEEAGSQVITTPPPPSAPQSLPSGGRAHLFRPAQTRRTVTRTTAACYL